MKNYLLTTVCVFNCFIFQVNAQNSVVDSLFNVLKKSKQDTNRVKALNLLATVDGWKINNFDNVDKYTKESIALSKKLKFNHGLISAYGALGISLSIQGEYIQATECFEKVLKFSRINGDIIGEAGALGNLGIVFRNLGQLPKALDYQLKALAIKEKMNDPNEFASSYNNIANIYSMMNENQMALKYHQKALKIRLELKDIKSISASYNNIGQVYYSINDLDRALVYFNKTKTLCLELNNINLLATAYNNIASVYEHKNNYDSALYYNQLSLNIKKKANLISLIPISLSNIGDVYLEKHKPNEAKKMYLEAYQLAKQIGSLEFIRDAFRGLFRVDSALGNHSQALQNFKQYVIFRDSLFNAENQKKGLSMMFEYEYSKKHVQDSITYAKQKEIQQAKIEKQQTEIKAKQTQQYMLFGGLGLVFLFSGFMYNRFKKTQKQKQIIEHQQLETESQKRLLEVKNKEIHDSITYAKRIQEAILPSSSLLNEYLKNGFVYFNPKDIVSGDFYWLEKVGNAVFLAAADCTGHGVPGAMVSVVCANALSKALLEENITETGKLLDRTRELVIERFDNSNEDVKDGMDISLCKLEGKTVQWSGANNPLWVVRAHASEIEEYKADKQPIGKSANQTPFSSVTLSLNSGDSLYLFTDGYADQFGGEKGKKFMYKPLKELLLSMSTSSMDSQRNQLETQFQQWKGELEQVDDVCVIGIRI